MRLFKVIYQLCLNQTWCSHILLVLKIRKLDILFCLNSIIERFSTWKDKFRIVRINKQAKFPEMRKVIFRMVSRPDIWVATTIAAMYRALHYMSADHLATVKWWATLKCDAHLVLKNELLVTEKKMKGTFFVFNSIALLDV